MKIAFVTECDYAVPHGDVEGCDVIVFPFYYKEPVSYNSEIKGSTTFFKTLTNLSKCLKTTVIAGVDTDSYGALRHSVAVCDNGKLLGISDMISVREGDSYVGGGSLRVYETRAGKIGIIAGGDVFCSECIRTLAQCGADVIVSVCDPILDNNVGISARAKAYEFGVPIAVCANKNAMLALTSGELAFCSPKKVTVANVRVDKEYHLVTLRRRGRKQQKNRS